MSSINRVELNKILDEYTEKCIEIINTTYNIEAILSKGDNYDRYNLSFSYTHTKLDDILDALRKTYVIQYLTIIETNENGIFISFGVREDFLNFCKIYFKIFNNDKDFDFLETFY